MTKIEPLFTAVSFDVYIDHVCRCVEVSGELDIATIGLMLEAIALLPAKPYGDITVDLSFVSFLSAGALGALVGVSNGQRAQGALLYVIGNSRVQSVAGRCGLGFLLAVL